MRRGLPSISALTAFEAVARHASVTRAADELSLTESAVSRQISLLEDLLGVQLFHRIKKRLSLTRAGAVYATRVSQVISRIERDAREIIAQGAGGGVLEIGAQPTVGPQWLIPRLKDFYARHPQVTVNVSSRATPFFFAENALDGALYFGRGHWPDAQSDYLFDELLLPVGCPELMKGDQYLDRELIVEQRLLHLMARPDAWRNWCINAGLDQAKAMQGPRFEIQSMLISAASSGLGVALLPHFLIEEALREGKLKLLSDLSLKWEGAYYFACPDEKVEDPLLRDFREWLQEQARSARQL